MDILEFEDESLKKHLDIMLGKDSNKIQFLVTSILNGNLVNFAFWKWIPKINCDQKCLNTP